MHALPSDRVLTKSYKEELRSLVKKQVEKNRSEDARVALLTALGEMTAEFGISIIGRETTFMLFLELASSVQANVANDPGIRPD